MHEETYRPPRVCRWCGESLAGRRSHARFCSDGCRSIASQLVRILRGQRVNGYDSVRARLAASDNRTRGAEGLLSWMSPGAAEAEAYYKRRAAIRAQTSRERSRLGHGPYGVILLGDPCSYCGRPASQIDHIEPGIDGGASHWSNFTAACGSCNASKNAEPLLLWMSHRG